MERLDYGQFVASRREFDTIVGRSGGPAETLSGGEPGSCWYSPWQIAAHDALHGVPSDPEAGRAVHRPDERAHLIYRADRAWLALVEYEIPGVFVPFEHVWMFASPLVGEPAAAVELLAAVVDIHRHELRGLLLGGLPVGGQLLRLLRLAQGRGSRKQALEEQPGTESCIIDLVSGGVDAWLGRRTRNFRRTARRAELPADAVITDGLAITPEEALARMISIQTRSYKARQGGDIFGIDMYRDFYRRLLVDVHASGELRLTFVTIDGDDLAYHFGSTQGVHYRGYQMSFAEEARSLGLGTALQMRHLRRAAEEGVARYDMGMLAPYKDRWCDRIERSVVVVLR